MMTSLMLAITCDHRSSRMSMVVTMVCLAPVLALATFRAPSIGRDVLTYQLPTFELAQQSMNFQSFILNVRNTFELQDLEFGYGLLVYLCARLSDSYFLLFFVQSVLIVLPYVAALVMVKKYIINSISGFSVGFTTLIFLVLQYNLSLSAVRQTIACSLGLWAIVLFQCRFRIIPLLLIVIASSFHNSGILLLGILILWQIIKRFSERRVLQLVVLLAVLMVSGYDLLLNTVIVRLSDAGLFGSKFVDWQNNDFYSQSSGDGINVTWLAISLLMLLLSWLTHKMLDTKVSLFFFVISITLLATFPFASSYTSFARVQLYFIYFAPLIFSYFISASNYKLLLSDCTDRRRKSIVIVLQCITLLLCSCFWLSQYVYFDYTDTVPYIFY